MVTIHSIPVIGATIILLVGFISIIANFMSLLYHPRTVILALDTYGIRKSIGDLVKYTLAVLVMYTYIASLWFVCATSLVYFLQHENTSSLTTSMGTASTANGIT